MKGFAHSRFIRLLSIAGFFVVALLLLTPSPTNAAGEFTTIWQTDIEDPADASISIPVHPTSSTYTYNYDVDWGDGNTTTGVTSSVSHTYAAPGTYTVKISGDYPSYYSKNHADRHKLISVDAWGTIAWETFVDAFNGANNVVINATDAPDLTNVTSFNHIFANSSGFNSTVGGWDTSNVTDFSYAFHNSPSFNQDISAWDVTSAQTFTGMFYGASSFNQPLDSWAYAQAVSFNSMFRNATAFNQPLNSWRPVFLQDSRYMFMGATSFDQPLNDWRVREVVRLDYMFYGASSFNQNVGDWEPHDLQVASHMFTGSGLSDTNYDLLLIGWESHAQTSNVTLSAPNTYCNGASARANLISNLSWTINDAGEDLSTCGPTDVVFNGQGDPTIPEGMDPDALIGQFAAVDPDGDATHTYSLDCGSQYPDAQFFTFVDDQLFSTALFDYASPQDTDGDNSYDICVQVADVTGYTLEKEFSVTVTDVEEEEVEVEDGQVLGTNTGSDNATTSTNNSSNSSTGVLGDSAVLADTGVGANSIVVIGVTVSLLSMLAIRAKRTYVLEED